MSQVASPMSAETRPAAPQSRLKLSAPARLSSSRPASIGRVAGRLRRKCQPQEGVANSAFPRLLLLENAAQIPYSFLTSFRNRQSVPVAMILSGEDLIIPSSRSRNAQKRTASSAS